jgi:hypothetical protein
MSFVLLRLAPACGARLTRFLSPPPFGWRMVVVAIVLAPILAINIYGLARSWTNLLVAPEQSALDWLVLVRASGYQNPYAEELFRWSPVAAWAIALLAPLGVLLWRLLHFVALVALRDWRLITLLLLSAPLWTDVDGGSVMTFVAITAYTAYRGSRLGMVCFLVLAVLIPRPLMLPLLGWLLWTRPESRQWFAAIVVAHAAVLIWSGLGDEWLARLAASQSEIAHPTNIGPSRVIGAAWIPLGVVLGAWLTWRGHLGWASLAMTPYVFPYYLLMLVLEWKGGSVPASQQSARRPLLPPIPHFTERLRGPIRVPVVTQSLKVSSEPIDEPVRQVD